MDFISQIPHYVTLLFTSVLPFLFVLTVVVFFHELGHFMVARWYGVKVTDFSIGFGKEIFGFHDKHGTRWRFAWLPLGGYVKFVDDDNAASVPDADALEKLSGGRQGWQFSRQTSGAQSRCGCRRTDRQFHSRNRYFCRYLHHCRRIDYRAAAWQCCERQCG